MKITLRLVVSLVLMVGLVAVGFSFYQVRTERIRLTSELERRTIILAESIQESVTPLILSDSSKKLNRLVQRFSNRERFQGIAVHDAHGQVLAATADLDPLIPGSVAQVVHVLAEGQPAGEFLHGGKPKDLSLLLSAPPGREADRRTDALPRRVLHRHPARGDLERQSHPLPGPIGAARRHHPDRRALEHHRADRPDGGMDARSCAPGKPNPPSPPFRRRWTRRSIR